jgi:predicted transcriptional regulator
MKKGRKKTLLTAREEEIMQMLWSGGPKFVRELVEMHPDPKPHFNTVSTIIRILEEKGFVAHEVVGTSYRYFATCKQEEFRDRTLGSVIKGYFNNSYLGAVSTLIQEEKITVDELKELIDIIEKQK